MRSPILGAQFRRDVKRVKKRGRDMVKLREAILLLTEGGPLPPRYRDHPLSGECKAVKGDKYRALGPYDLLKSASPGWAKSEDWLIARRMNKTDIESTDLGRFLANL